MNLALGYQATGKLELALPIMEETLKLRSAKLGNEHTETHRSMNNLAMGYLAAGKLDLAIPLFEEALKLNKAKLGADHPDTVGIMGNLGGAYAVAKQGENATRMLKEYVATQRKLLPNDDPRFTGTLAQTATRLVQCDQFGAAEEMLRECLAIREKKQPAGLSTHVTKSQLGEALLGQKKYAEAERLLLAGYEGMKSREKAIPPTSAGRIPEAIDRLIAFYTATNKPDEAKKYRELRAKYPTTRPVAPPPRERK